jgi:hypothetical protein
MKSWKDFNSGPEPIILFSTYLENNKQIVYGVNPGT